MTNLFDAFSLKNVRLRNRVVVSPMCQYKAKEGMPNDWHRVHYAGLARGGAGLVVVEATAVSPEGRITPGCLGIWRDEQALILAEIAASIKAAGSVPGIQIGHAGRKASANVPWEGDNHIPEGDPRGWETMAPSAIAYGANLPRVPRAMTLDDIGRVRDHFVAAARRADAAGFDWLLLHFAHGYLAQNFFSPYSNQRADAYGGSLENRCRFMVETARAVRAIWPAEKPLTARVGVIEFDGHDDVQLEEAAYLLKTLKAEGVDFIDISMSFSTPEAHIPWGPALLKPIAQALLPKVGLPGSISWNVSAPDVAASLVAEGTVDLVFMGRALLANPHWPYSLAKDLKVDRAAWVLPAPYAHWLSHYA